MANKRGYKINLLDVHLLVKYLKPAPQFLSLIETRLSKEAAPYHICKPEIIVKPIVEGGRIFRMNHIFIGKLPHHAFFCIQKSSDFEGTITSNPFAFVPFSKFQFYANGKPYFAEPIEMKANVKGEYNNCAGYLQQLYNSLGMEMRGSCLINSKNFVQNCIVGLSLSPDGDGRTGHGYINPQIDASTQIEIDLGYTPPTGTNLVLIVYALYDRLIKIDGNRQAEIIE